MKKTARSASSSSSASTHRSEPRATDRSNPSAASERNSLDICAKNSSTGDGRVNGARIVVLRAGSLGDTILALPALRALHEWSAGGRIELVGYPAVLRLVSFAVPVHAIHSIDSAVFAGLFRDPPPTDVVQLFRRFDVVVAWVRKESGDLGWILDGGKKVCIQANPSPPSGAGLHASHHLLQSLSPLGIGDALRPSELVFPSAASRAARGFLAEAGIAEAPFLALHPGSGSPRKNWDTQRFASLAARAREAGRPVLIIEGEADREVADALRDLLLPWRPPTAVGLELPVLGSVLSRAAVYVGNDSGVSHLAAASGAPTLALFGPTDPGTWAPLGRSVAVIRTTASDQEVWEAVRQLLRGPK